MNQPKNIQIRYELFTALIEYICSHPDNNDPRYSEIMDGIREKLDAMARHDLYTLYKTGVSAVVREQARQKYLEEMGITPSFRWNAEQDINVLNAGRPKEAE